MRTALLAFLFLFMVMPALGQTMDDYASARGLDIVKVFGPYEIRDFSKGGPDDPPALEFMKVDVIAQEFDWANHIAFIVGATDSTKWPGYAPKERYTLDNSLGLARGQKVIDRLLAAGVDSANAIQLQPKHWNRYRGAYIYVAEVEQKPERATMIVNNITVVGDTSERTVLSPLSAGAGISYHMGQVKTALPTVALRLKLLEHVFLQYSFGYWEKAASDKFGSRSFVAHKGSVLYFPADWLGFELGAGVVEERVRYQNEFLQQESGLFAGVRLRVPLSHSFAVEGFGHVHGNNLNRFAIQGTQSQYTGSIGAQITFTPTL